MRPYFNIITIDTYLFKVSSTNTRIQAIQAIEQGVKSVQI